MNESRRNVTHEKFAFVKNKFKDFGSRTSKRGTLRSSAGRYYRSKTMGFPGGGRQLPSVSIQPASSIPLGNFSFSKLSSVWEDNISFSQKVYFERKVSQTQCAPKRKPFKRKSEMYCIWVNFRFFRTTRMKMAVIWVFVQ